jgi:hypothetical protein
MGVDDELDTDNYNSSQKSDDKEFHELDVRLSAGGPLYRVTLVLASTIFLPDGKGMRTHTVYLMCHFCLICNYSHSHTSVAH